MIVGIGTDMVEIERIQKACENIHFFERVFTEKERELGKKNISTLAGNFAVKESVVKAFGTGFRGIEFQEIEVLRDLLGKPYIILYGKAEEKQKELGINQLYVSITNTKQYAMAFVVGESGEV